jgi:hypothetical protein
MDSQYQLQPGQYSQPQNVQSGYIPSATGQVTAQDNHQYPGLRPSEATYTTNSSTTTTTQQYTISSSPRYLQQISQYLPTPPLQTPVVPTTVQAPYPHSSIAGANYLTQAQYSQNQQSMTAPQPQPFLQPLVIQPQSQNPIMLQQSQQQVTQQSLMASGVQDPDQSQHVAYQQQQLYQQPQLPQQPSMPPLIDFKQLLQSAPDPQHVPGNDFTQLMQAAPPVNTPSNILTTTTTRTETYRGANAGGEARKLAEAKGEQEVQRYEEKVQKLIRRVGTCPSQKSWYNSVEGYICGEGIHFLYHQDIDKAFKEPGWIPRVTWVNTLDDPEAQGSGTWHLKHPPPVVFHESMHRQHREFMRVVRNMGFALLGSQADDLRRKGCDDACLRGLESVSKKEGERDLRQRGYDPDATRHAMFRRCK